MDCFKLFSPKSSGIREGSQPVRHSLALVVHLLPRSAKSDPRDPRAREDARPA
jgi:hypothetical protein